MNTAHLKRILEAALLSSGRPLSLAELGRLFDDPVSGDLLRALLEEVRMDWALRPVHLVHLASGWGFQTTLDVAPFLGRLNSERLTTYSRAIMEVLATIAYRQPVTRGDIEEIRGVTVSSQAIRTLQERGWIEVVGHREIAGRPELLGTTQQFLDDLGLAALAELPDVSEGGDLAEALEASKLGPQATTTTEPNDLAPPRLTNAAPALSELLASEITVPGAPT